MFEILITTIMTFGPSLIVGFVVGLAYFYWMQRSIRAAVGAQNGPGLLVFNSMLRLVCLACILIGVLQFGFRALVFFMIGFTVARLLMVSIAAYKTGGSDHAV